MIPILVAFTVDYVKFPPGDAEQYRRQALVSVPVSALILQLGFHRKRHRTFDPQLAERNIALRENIYIYVLHV